jgi:hypothetical protein
MPATLPFTADSAETWLIAGKVNDTSKENSAKPNTNFLAITHSFRDLLKIFNLNGYGSYGKARRLIVLAALLSPNRWRSQLIGFQLVIVVSSSDSL